MLEYFTIATIVFIALFIFLTKDDDFGDIPLIPRTIIICGSSLFLAMMILMILLIIESIICSNQIIWILAYVCICFVAGYILSKIINKGD